MKCFKYSNRPKSYITVKMLDEPYGDTTEKVVSIGCTLKGDMQNPTWKVHVPLDLAESVGQELIRLARTERAKSEKEKAKPSRQMTLRLVKDDEGPDVTHPPGASLLGEIQTQSENAMSEGRVVKRPRKKEE